MKPFDTLLRLMHMMGLFQEDKSSRNKFIRIILNCVVIGIFLIYIVSTIWYFLFTAQKFTEYTECVYYITCALAMPVFYLTFLWQGKEFNRFLTELNEIIESSEFKLWLITLRISNDSSCNAFLNWLEQFLIK